MSNLVKMNLDMEDMPSFMHMYKEKAVTEAKGELLSMLADALLEENNVVVMKCEQSLQMVEAMEEVNADNAPEVYN